jgi:hypothetical protein
MTEQKSDADILAEAREYFDRHGWTKDVLRNEDGYVCALGGIIYSQGWVDEDNYDVEHEHVNDCMRLSGLILRAAGKKNLPGKVGVGLNRLTAWNDDCDRDYEQVYDAFMKAEKIARGGAVDGRAEV